MKAFAGESQARNNYTFYASVAKEEGFEQISAIFETPTTRRNMRNLFKHIIDGMKMDARYGTCRCRLSGGSTRNKKT